MASLGLWLRNIGASTIIDRREHSSFTLNHLPSFERQQVLWDSPAVIFPIITPSKVMFFTDICLNYEWNPTCSVYSISTLGTTGFLRRSQPPSSTLYTQHWNKKIYQPFPCYSCKSNYRVAPFTVTSRKIPALTMQMKMKSALQPLLIVNQWIWGPQV